MWRASIGILFLLIAATAMPAGAGAMDDALLRDLFARLQKVESPEEARALEGRIWGRWMETGDATADNLLAQGTMAMSTGDYRVAVALFNAVIERKPDSSEAFNKRATLYFLVGDFEASVADIVRTLALEPRHFGALSGLGMIEAERKNYKAALEAYTRALAVDPHLQSVKDQVDLLTEVVKGKKI